ncbi:MAG: A/G-specific adenine glycosylase, partial [Candidatus Poribacteria bacterium]
MLNSHNRDDFERRLLEWYGHAKRDLPWRDVDDPYAVLVSEVMLQQTQVATAIPHFERFMAAFPTVADLARAGEDDVLRGWQGLGYYSRARNLHRAAQRVVEFFHGRIPDTVEELRTLPGVGPYTAGAVASIAFCKPEPIVDANVARVLSRVFAVPGDPKSRATSR